MGGGPWTCSDDAEGAEWGAAALDHREASSAVLHSNTTRLAPLLPCVRVYSRVHARFL